MEHQVSQESPKTAKKPPKMVPGSHQEPYKKWVNFVTPLLPGNGPKNDPKSDPKSATNWSQTCSKKHSFQDNLLPQNEPQNGLSWRSSATVEYCRSYLASSCFQDGPKMAQDGPESPKIASWEPSWVFIDCLGRPWTPKNVKKQMVF